MIKNYPHYYTKTQFSVGQSQAITAKISLDDIARFSELSGDFAALHSDDKFARRAGFEGVIVHGAFLSALVSRLVGMTFPGPYAILERMDLSFRQPCYAPCELRVSGTVKQVSEAVNSIILDVVISDSSSRVLATGKTWHRIMELKG